MLDVVFIVALAIAIARAVRARFIVGVVGGVVRLLLVLASVAAIGVGMISSGMGASHTPIGLLVFVAGPLLSFSMAFFTWHRRRNIPYAQEEAADRLFMPWVAVACVDAVSVTLALLVLALATSS